MLSFPKIDPVLIEIGPLKVRWYGLMYVVGFVAAYFLVGRQQRARDLGLRGAALQDLFFFLAVGLILGARLGYILFYQFSNLGIYVAHPLEIIAVWHGGMSFHGGLIGALVAGVIFCRRRELPVLQAADLVIPAAPIGVGLGRLGNFINGELYGRPSQMPWAMVFPGAGPEPRHPSQLYEALLEGLVLFVLLWLMKDRLKRPGGVLCLFLFGYGIFRFVAEFFRAPDPQIGLLWWGLSMGQVLCLSMVAAGATLWAWTRSAETSG
jgi:phosphatidylglycerol:prolipoprotein diacylglycerol transferase